MGGHAEALYKEFASGAHVCGMSSLLGKPPNTFALSGCYIDYQNVCGMHAHLGSSSPPRMAYTPMGVELGDYTVLCTHSIELCSLHELVPHGLSLDIAIGNRQYSQFRPVCLVSRALEYFLPHVHFCELQYN